jgi:hypothetical protein
MRGLVRGPLVAAWGLWCALAAAGCHCKEEPGTDAGADAGSDSAVPACDPALTLDSVLPAVPAPTGGAQAAFAGEITGANAAAELIGGDAASGMVGDYFLRNDRIRVLIMRPGNFYAWGRYGGNIIDADIVRPAAEPGNDQFGKLNTFYRTGRTADFDTCTVIQDGAAGGAAVVRCTGTDQLLDSLNVASAVPLPLDERLSPEIPLPLQIAATYVLEPGADHVEVHWTFLNLGTDPIATNLGYLLDTGGLIEVFQPKVGFGALGFAAILAGGDSSPWIGYQGPDIAYGVIPYNLDAAGNVDPTAQNAQLTISGVSVTLFRAASILEAFNADVGAMQIEGCAAMDQPLDFVVSSPDVGAVGTRAVATLGLGGGSVSGTVTVGGAPAGGVRVVALEDLGTLGVLDGADVPWSSFQTAADGTYGGDLPAGDWLLLTDGKGLAYDPALPDGVFPVALAAAGQATADFDLPAPATVDYVVTDADTGTPLPARIMVIGDDSSPCKRKWRDCDEGDSSNPDELVNQLKNALAGDSAVDGALRLEPGSYRVFVTHGPEWTEHDEVINVAAGDSVTVTAALRRMIDTTGYVAGDFHQHGVNSPDAPVTLDERVRAYPCEGVEFIASSDHDFLTDYAPVIASLGAGAWLESSVGVETTTFDYGHFNAFPLTVDPLSPTNGAIDWANGDTYLNIGPDMIFMEHRARGALVVQVNHPRNSAFLGNFDQASLIFDYATRYVGDDPMNVGMRAAVRLSDTAPLFSPNFDSFEVWNGFSGDDSNGDGVREDVTVDAVFYDWMRFTAFGLLYTGMGNSDSHRVSLKMAGYPRTMVAVPDDTAIGSLEADVMATLNGSGPAPRDTVVTDAPMLRVVDDNGISAVGRVLDASGGPVFLTVEVRSPEYAPIDTLELFLGTSDDDGSLRPAGSSALIPSLCFTDRTGLTAGDTCALATAGAPGPLDAMLVGSGGDNVWIASEPLQVTANGDTFVFVRVYGTVAILPILPTAISGVTPADIVAGTAALDNNGVPAMAIVGPILIDADGDGVYTAPYAP